ncbi:hypothetical protein [Streptomyces sp. NPDC088180]|uniref:hypothetical protein n=1 Tax=Streptomyces sp. NPDC088180 TaxID=3365837 RepID=UPI0037F4F8D3
MGSKGVVVDGGAGTDAATMAHLAGLQFALPAAAGWLSPDQQVRLLAVVGTVTSMVRLLANDPAAAIEHGELSRVPGERKVAWRPARKPPLPRRSRCRDTCE